MMMYCSWFVLLILCYGGDCTVNEKSNLKTTTSQFENKQTICSGNKLVVKGYDVNISFVLKDPCFGKVRFIEVFALNQLYIDADFDATGQQVQLSLIAPVWTIIGNKKIILNGKNGEEHKSLHAPDGIGSFRHGQPGNPGGSAGKLLGIAYRITDEPNLQIYMNGGTGGTGQHGGKGINGIDGEDPPIPDDSSKATSLWESQEFVYETTNNQNITNDDTIYNYMNIRVFGRNPTKPGDGGNGGVGGIGGYAGLPIIIALKDQKVPPFFAKPGNNGSIGNGGSCGSESRSGYIFDFFFRDEYSVSTGKVVKLVKPSPVVNSSSKSFGKDGIDGFNDIGIKYPNSVNFINPSHVINDYKSYVRHSVVIGNQTKPTIDLVNEIEKSESVQSLYNSLGLVHDMMGIETQYSNLKKKTSTTPYFTSLLKRTEKHAQGETEPTENKGVLTWLYTAIMMRISFVTTNSIVDLPEYVNEIEADIAKLRRNEIQVNAEDRQQSMISEIQSIVTFIEDQYFPDLENILVEIGSHVSALMNELFERQYKFIPPKKDDEESMIILSDDDLYAIIGERTFMIGARNETNDKCSNGPHQFSNDLVSELIESTMKMRKRQKYELLEEQLNDVERELYQFSKLESDSDDLRNVIENVAQLRSYLSEQLLKCTLHANDIDRVRDDLILLFERKQLEFEVFGDILAILNVRDVSTDSYRGRSVDNIVDLDEIKAFSEEMERAAEQANLKVEYIYDTISEQYIQMETNVKEIVRQPIPESYSGLEESKSHLIDTIRNVKAFFRKVSNDTTVMELLSRSCEKLDDTIISLYEAYGYIAHLKESIRDNRIENTTPDELQYSPDSALNVATKNLEKMIQTNVLLEKYESAVSAFKKQLFPFENKILLSDLELPKTLQPDDNEKLTKVVIDHFAYLKNKVTSLDVLIGKYDQFQMNDIEFSHNENSLVGPFYEWHLGGKLEDTKIKLLRFEEIELTPSIGIAKALDIVKFKEIGIQLITDKSKQSELNEELEKCIVTMTMTGTSSYRCGTKTHNFEVEDNISFISSFKRDSNGKPVMKNEIYDKVYGKKNYYLSPYATWKIQIESINGAKLLLFEKDKIDLYLVGRGQYVKCRKCLTKVCEKLD